MLPRIKIFFDNGALGLTTPSPDGLIGILCTGVAVAEKFALASPYILYSLDDLSALGITSDEADVNAEIYKIIREFYAEAGAGVEVWLMAFADTVKLSEMVDIANANYGKKLADAANGRLRGIVISRKPGAGYEVVIEDGLDSDVAAALPKAQEFAEHYTNNRYAPLFVMVEGAGYTGVPANLADLTQSNFNRVGVFIGDTVSGSGKATMGTLAGRIAISPVQRNIGRVKDGPLAPVAAYIHNTPVELADVNSLYDKGYITLRTYVARSGYFFTDDTLATLPTDDYRYLVYRRTIDKAYRIAYQSLLDQLLDEVPVNADGTMQVPIVKGWQADVEGAIARNMAGEISADATAGDTGVRCFIDPNQNLISSSVLKVQIRIRPFGYPRFIDVYLGFQTIVQN